jgi:hypothetical protein
MTIQPGSTVLARTAFGDELTRIAQTGVEMGRDFLVVWVTVPQEWEKAQAEGREPDSVPWPAEDVRPAEPATSIE